MELPEGSEYVALGSSYAAGPGLGDRVPGSPRAAGRSTHNYAHLLAARLRLKLRDATFSGATIAQLLGREAGTERLSQLDALTTDTRLVTLTGGGNDIGYIGSLIFASLPTLVGAVTGTSRRLAKLTDPDEFARKAAELADAMVTLFTVIRTRAPRAAIAVTDYLTLLPPEASISAHPLAMEAAERGRQYFHHLNLILRQASARSNVTFADVSTVSAPHHAWSSEPWTERFVLFGGKAALYHPNRDGMTVVADELEAALRRS